MVMLFSAAVQIRGDEMSTTAIARELHERLEQATAVSMAASQRAARAVAVAADAHAHSRLARSSSVDTRARRSAHATHAAMARQPEGHRAVRAFRIEGVVDGVAAHAHWSARGLECSP